MLPGGVQFVKLVSDQFCVAQSQLFIHRNPSISSFLSHWCLKMKKPDCVKWCEKCSQITQAVSKDTVVICVAFGEARLCWSQRSQWWIPHSEACFCTGLRQDSHSAFSCCAPTLCSATMPHANSMWRRMHEASYQLSPSRRQLVPRDNMHVLMLV